MARTIIPTSKKPIVRSRRKPPPTLAPKQPKKAVRSVRQPPRTGPLIKNWGGYMLNPPDHCPHRMQAKDGGVWVDNNICNGKYCGHYPCSRRTWWMKAKGPEKTKYWYEAGVISFTPFK